jgi:hypothetical protein
VAQARAYSRPATTERALRWNLGLSFRATSRNLTGREFVLSGSTPSVHRLLSGPSPTSSGQAAPVLRKSAVFEPNNSHAPDAGRSHPRLLPRPFATPRNERGLFGTRARSSRGYTSAGVEYGTAAQTIRRLRASRFHSPLSPAQGSQTRDDSRGFHCDGLRSVALLWQRQPWMHERAGKEQLDLDRNDARTRACAQEPLSFAFDGKKHVQGLHQLDLAWGDLQVAHVWNVQFIQPPELGV